MNSRQILCLQVVLNISIKTVTFRLDFIDLQRKFVPKKWPRLGEDVITKGLMTGVRLNEKVLVTGAH